MMNDKSSDLRLAVNAALVWLCNVLGILKTTFAKFSLNELEIQEQLLMVQCYSLYNNMNDFPRHRTSFSNDSTYVCIFSLFNLFAY